MKVAFFVLFQVDSHFETNVFSSVTAKPLKDWRIIQMTLHYLGRKGRSFFFLHRQKETQLVFQGQGHQWFYL